MYGRAAAVYTTFFTTFLYAGQFNKRICQSIVLRPGFATARSCNIFASRHCHSSVWFSGIALQLFDAASDARCAVLQGS
ncbi:hypothetical protein C3D80_20650, partial [Cronobacter sakazakii]